MSATNTHNSNTTNNAGVPPAPPEAHQKAVCSTVVNFNTLNQGTEMQNVHVNAETVNNNEGSALVLPSVIAEGTEVQMIPLKRLVKSPYNQRKKAPTGLEALAANIKASGLLQNLVVHPMKAVPKKAQTFGIAAGQRRHGSLCLLLDAGDITGDFLVPCKVVPVSDAILVSAAENDMREPAHPADQCDAYKALVESGRSAEYIAAIYGTTAKTVARRLKLANVSPKLFELFRNDVITLEQIQVLAVTDDHEKQEAVWFGAQQDWQRQPHSLRSRLVDDKMALSNPCVRFVGAAAYEKAGGIIERDLFSQGDVGYIANSTLLMELFDAKIAGEVETLQAEGWAWVESRSEYDYSEMSAFGKLEPTPVALTPEQQTEYEAMATQLSELEAKRDASYDAEEGEEGYLSDEDADALDAQIDGVEAQIRTVESRDAFFSDEQKRVSGAIVYVALDGSVGVKRGLVRAEDRAAARATVEAVGGDVPHNLRKQGGVKGIHSEKLTRDLTAHRTIAVQAELAKRADVALVVVVHKLVTKVFDRLAYSTRESSAAQISVTVIDHQLKNAASGIQQSADWLAVRDMHEQWRAKLPKDLNALFPWLLEQDQQTLLSLLALCTALTIDGVSGTEDAHAINTIAGALDLDMSQHWTATAAGYFSHVSKARIVDVLTAAVSPEVANQAKGMKKPDAAAFAEAQIAGKAWTPEVFASAQAPTLVSYDDEEDEAEDANDAELAAGDDNTVLDAANNDEAATDEADSEPVAAAKVETVVVPSAHWPFPTGMDARSAFASRAAH